MNLMRRWYEATRKLLNGRGPFLLQISLLSSIQGDSRWRCANFYYLLATTVKQTRVSQFSYFFFPPPLAIDVRCKRKKPD